MTKALLPISSGLVLSLLVAGSLAAQATPPSPAEATLNGQSSSASTQSAPPVEIPVATAPPAATDSVTPSNEPIEEVTDVQEVAPGTVWDPQAFPAVERSVNLLTAHTTRRNALQISIDHRPFEKAFGSNWFRDWFGFDYGSLKIGIGLRYGILDDLDVGFLRSNGTGGEVFDVYQFDLRYRLLREDRHFINLALRAGPTWFAQPSKQGQALGGFAQLLIDRTFFNRLTVGTGLLYHSNSSGTNKANTDPNPSAALAAWVDVRPLPWLVWDLEITGTVAGYAEKYPIVSTAVKFLTNRHTFSLVLSNTQYMSADGIVANTYRRPKDMILGFTITREIDL